MRSVLHQPTHTHTPVPPSNTTAPPDALEAFLPTVGDAVRASYAMAVGDPSFAAGLAAAKCSLNDFLMTSLLLPVSDLFSFVDLMYAANTFVPSDVVVLAVFNQVRPSVLCRARAAGVQHHGMCVRCGEQWMWQSRTRPGICLRYRATPPTQPQLNLSLIATTRRSKTSSPW